MSSKNRVRCTGSNLPLTRTVPSVSDPYHHWSATCPDCGRSFNLPHSSLAVHYRCPHRDVSRPTLERLEYVCNDCQAVICEAFPHEIQALLNAEAERLSGSTVQVRPNALVSGAEGARSYSELPAGALVADEFGRPMGTVQGPYVSVSAPNRAHDAEVLLVVVQLFTDYAGYHPDGEDEVCISGRYLQPLAYGPEPLATLAGLTYRCHECGGNTTHWPVWPGVGRCTPAGHYLPAAEPAECQGCASRGAIVAHYSSCPVAAR